MVKHLFCILAVISFQVWAGYAPKEIVEDYTRASYYENLCKIYDVGKQANFRDETKYVNVKQFKEANPKARITKLTTVTKQLGLLAYLIESVDSETEKTDLKKIMRCLYLMSIGRNPMRQSDPEDDENKMLIELDAKALRSYLKDKNPEDYLKKFSRTLTAESSKADVIFWYYIKNFDEALMDLKYRSEQYIYKVTHQLNLWNKREKIEDNLFQFKEEDEQALCDYFCDVISKLDEDKGDQAFNVGAVVKLKNFSSDPDFFFNRLLKDNFLNFSYQAYHKLVVTGMKTLVHNVLKKERSSNDSLYLYRAADSFIDSEGKEHSFSVRNKEGKPHSNSFGDSILENLFLDPGATPITYWNVNKSNMYCWSIPINDVSDLVKRKILHVRPYFGITGMVIGQGEFHHRSTLPKDVFEKDGKTWIKASYTGGNGEHNLPKSWSYHLLNSQLSLDELEKEWEELNKYCEVLK